MNKGKILIIDDSPTVTAMSQYILEKAQYLVFTAVNGSQGLAKARNQKPDLIILDIILPDLDGYKVLELLKGDPETRAIPVLVYTTLGIGTFSEIASERGAAGFLSKPFQEEDLIKAVERYI
ncbi:response regulator [bacterium]|nr:response regulator [bacterium]